MEGNEGYMWEQPLVDSVALFERINVINGGERGTVGTGAQGIVDYTPK